MIRRLRKRFIRIATLAVAGVLLLLCLSVNLANYLSVTNGLHDTLRMIADNEGVIPREPSGKGPGSAPAGSTPFTPETPFSTRYFVLRYTASGELVKASLDHIAAVTEDDLQPYLDAALKHGGGFGRIGGYEFYVIQHTAGRWMAVFLDSYREMHTVSVFALWSLAAMAVCVALVYLIVVLCSRRAIDPVVKSAERQKQFITDASHELKTPITVIATSLTVLEMEVGQQKWIDKAQAQTEKLKELVQSLVTLCRLDEENSPLQMRPFPISDALAETAESFCDYAASSGHSLEISIEPGLSYTGDEYAVRQLASILLDNAVKYAAAGSPISFTLEKSKKGVLIRTENACQPLDPSELPKLFDRFYRADKSRSASGGFGIGLSIARGIAEGHKGSIQARSSDGCHIEFLAELR